MSISLEFQFNLAGLGFLNISHGMRPRTTGGTGLKIKFGAKFQLLRAWAYFQHVSLLTKYCSCIIVVKCSFW